MFYLDNSFIVELCDRTGMTPEKAQEYALDLALDRASRGRGGVETCYLVHFAEELRETLLETPQEETVKTVQRFALESEDAVRLIVASWVNGRKGDGRLYRTVQEWASNVTSREFCGCPLHSCYLNKVVLNLFVAPGQNVPMF